MFKKKKGINVNGKDPGDFTVPEYRSADRLHEGRGTED